MLTRMIVAITKARLIKWRRGNKIGAPDILPFNLAKAITDPEKVIAPIAAPSESSKRLNGLIPVAEVMPKLSGLKKAAIATSTAANPTRE